MAHLKHLGRENGGQAQYEFLCNTGIDINKCEYPGSTGHLKELPVLAAVLIEEGFTPPQNIKDLYREPVPPEEKKKEHSKPPVSKPPTGKPSDDNQADKDDKEYNPFSASSSSDEDEDEHEDDDVVPGRVVDKKADSKGERVVGDNKPEGDAEANADDRRRRIPR